jgi:MtN3 and saliva related transmembrane protein
MSAETVIGLVAGMLTTIAFVPQAWQVWKSRSARDLSLPMYLIFTSGVALWLVYGVMSGALPVIVANSITLLLAGAVLVMKLRFG